MRASYTLTPSPNTVTEPCARNASATFSTDATQSSSTGVRTPDSNRYAAANTSPIRASSIGQQTPLSIPGSRDMAASVGTPTNGMPRPKASPFHVAKPTRRPVNEPGPTLMASALTSASSTPASSSAHDIVSSRRSACVRPQSTTVSARIWSSLHTATVLVRVAVSPATIIMFGSYGAKRSQVNDLAQAIPPLAYLACSDI